METTIENLDPTSLIEARDKEVEFLRTLLDERLARRDALFVEVTKMAGTESYVATLTFQQVAMLMHFAKDLGLFKAMFDSDTGQMKIDHDTIEEIMQRPLDHTRQLPLTIYLAGRKYHKFPAILAVQTDDWVDNPTDTQFWERGEDGEWRARQDSTRFTPLDGRRRIGLLELIGYIYALDGQHRLLGIKGLIELISTRRLVQRSKNGDPKKGDPLTMDVLARDYGIDELRLTALQNETIAVEIFPAVKQGETRTEARRRVKSVFTHVNKSAVMLTAGQIAQLDEDDGFAIVAKRVAVHHSLLKSTGTRISRVNWQTSTISNTSTVLTTLQTLTEVSEGFLKDAYPHWVSPIKDLIPVRPDDDELEKGEERLSEFLDGLASLRSMQDLDRGETTRLYRLLTTETVTDGPPKVKGQAHLLFRPVGQIVLARAFGTLVIDQGNDMDELFRMLRDYETAGGFAIDNPSNPWWGVIYDPVGQKIARGNERTAELILTWLLGGISDSEKRSELLEELANRRMIRDGGPNDGKVLDFDGNYVDEASFRLPAMLT